MCVALSVARKSNYDSQDSLARRICRIRPSKSITKSVLPLALLQNVTISFQRLDAGLWRLSHGSSPSSCSKSAEATISLWLLFSVREWLNTLPALRNAPPKPSLVHVFGTLKETKRFLSPWTVFQRRSLSPSASGTSVPWEVKEFNRLGAGAEVLTATDFEFCWVMSRICFTSSGILYSLLSTKAWSSACCKAFIQGIRMNWQCLASRTCIWTTWAAPANPTKDQWLCWSLLWPLRVGQKGLPKWRHPRRLSHVARELRFAGLASSTSPSSLVDTAKSPCGLGASDSQSRGVWLPTFCVCKHLRRQGKS